KKPAQRYASAAELADALRRFLDGLPAQVRPRDDRPRRRFPRAIVSAFLQACVWTCLWLLIVYFWKLPAHFWWMKLVSPPIVFLVFLVLMYPLARTRYQATVNLLVFSPDGSTLAVTNGRTVELWDVAGERLRVPLNIPYVPASPPPGRFDLGDRKAI